MSGPLPKAPRVLTHVSNPPKGFVGHVLEKASEPDKLQQWFIKPSKSLIDDQPSGIAPNRTYADVPDELRRGALLRRAETFYEDSNNRRRPSKLLVDFLTWALMLPAFVVFTCSTLAYKLHQRRRRPKSSKTASSSTPNPPPQNHSSQSDPEPKPTTSNLTTPSIPEPPSPKSRHAYEFDNVKEFSRSWALYIVYMPKARYLGTGGIKGAILPSQTPKFLSDHAAALQKGRELEQNAQQELDRVKRLLKRAIQSRRDDLERAERMLDDPRTEENDARYENAVKKYEARQKAAMRLQMAVDDAQHQLEWVREVARTETCAAATSYRGIADWAKDAHDSYANLMNAISGVCFVGAGLTYSSIFSATRGNIGLMCWAFSLFIVGLAILITVQSLLMWCSRLENYPFSTPKLWEFFLGIGVYGACAAVVTAITLLVVTVLSLTFNVGDQGNTYMNPNASPWDAHLIFNVSPRWAAIVAFGFIGAGVIVALLVFLLFSMANSMKLLLWRRSIERSRKPRVKLEDLV